MARHPQLFTSIITRYTQPPFRAPNYQLSEYGRVHHGSWVRVYDGSSWQTSTIWRAVTGCYEDVAVTARRAATATVTCKVCLNRGRSGHGTPWSLVEKQLARWNEVAARVVPWEGEAQRIDRFGSPEVQSGLAELYLRLRQLVVHTPFDADSLLVFGWYLEQYLAEMTDLFLQERFPAAA